MQIHFQCHKNVANLCSILLLLCLLNVVNGADYLTEKPNYVETCKINEPGFTECSTRSIQKLLNQLVIGIEGITDSDKLGSLDPLKIKKIVFKQDNNQAATLEANITELVAKGFAQMVIKESKVSKKDYSWDTKIFLPRLRLDGKYQMSGKVLLLPLSGRGNMFIDLDQVDIDMHTKTRLYEKGGFTFYNVTDVRVQVEIKGLKTYFDNLFNGKSKEVEVSTNELFNRDWRDFYEALRPLIAETVESIIFSIMSPTFHYIPANFIVEDIPTPAQLYGKQA